MTRPLIAILFSILHTNNLSFFCVCHSLSLSVRPVHRHLARPFSLRLLNDSRVDPPKETDTQEREEKEEREMEEKGEGGFVPWKEHR